MKNFNWGTLALFGFVFLALMACKPKQGSTETTEEFEFHVDPNAFPKVIVDPSYDRTQAVDPFNVEKMYMTDSILNIEINYSGGCKEHDFALYSDGNYSKSLPPQMTLHLAHDNHDDHCRSIEKKTLSFNIDAIKYKKHGELILRLNRTKETVRFTY